MRKGCVMRYAHDRQNFSWALQLTFMKRNKISMAFATVSPIGLTSKHCPPVPLSYEREMCYSLLFFLFRVFQQFYQLKCQEATRKRNIPSYWDFTRLHKVNNCASIWHYQTCNCEIYVWLNHGPTVPFTRPLLWIPTPFGISGGNPTAIGGGAAVYNPWLWGKVWGLTWGLEAGLPLHCWRAWICLRPSSWIRDIVSNSCIDRASNPAP
jgi:hypothetical protein